MKKRIILFSFLLTCVASYAQTEIPGPNEDLTKRIIAGRQKTINESPFIFEGTVIKCVGFQAKNKGIYTSNTVQINKIFRGSQLIKLGTIEVITEGGTVEAILKDGSLGQRESYAAHGQITFYPGQLGTFFCMPADSSLTVMPLTTDNVIRTKYRDSFVYSSLNAWGAIQGMHLFFKSKEEFYDFLAKQKNITIPKTDIKKKSGINCYA